MGVAPTAAAAYQNAGYQTGYQQPYGGGGYDDGGAGGQRGSGGRRWIPWLVSGLVVVAAIIVAVVLLHGGSGNNTNVPLVDNLSWAQAESQIKAAGLNPVEAMQPSTSVDKGLVISTNPGNGDSAAKGATVTVTVSTGPANLSLGNYQGQQATAVQGQLTKEGFTQVSLVADPTSTATSGSIISQSPGAGSYPSSQPITLTYSGGATAVPNVIGDTSQEAAAILQQAGFTFTTNNSAAPSSQTPPPAAGIVWNQSPLNNTPEPKGYSVLLFVQPQNATTSPTDTSTTPSATPTDTTSTPGSSPTATPPTPTDSSTVPGG
jgi:serine/threonine-protein kinase